MWAVWNSRCIWSTSSKFYWLFFNLQKHFFLHWICTVISITALQKWPQEIEHKEILITKSKSKNTCAGLQLLHVSSNLTELMESLFTNQSYSHRCVSKQQECDPLQWYDSSVHAFLFHLSKMNSTSVLLS